MSPPRTDRERALDFIASIATLHLPPDTWTDTTDDTGRHIHIDAPHEERS